MPNTDVRAADPGLPEENLDVEIASAASQTFEPWSATGGLSPESIRARADHHLFGAQLALSTMQKTKDKLIAWVERDHKRMFDLSDGLFETGKAFEELAAMCKSASTRIVVAVAARYEQQGGVR